MECVNRMWQRGLNEVSKSGLILSREVKVCFYVFEVCFEKTPSHVFCVREIVKVQTMESLNFDQRQQQQRQQQQQQRSHGKKISIFVLLLSCLSRKQIRWP